MSKNWDLLGHEWAVDLLKSHLAQDHLRHAYLLTGPDGIGRRTLALRFAMALNHPDKIYDPEHRPSAQIARGEHPDLSIVQRVEGDRDLKIEAIRDLQHTLSLTPYMASYRVAVLLDFEQASAGASNALLKTLEEPPGRVVLILTAESAESLLPTIVSRCETLRLRPMPRETLADGLVKQHGVEEAQALLLAHLADGRPGTALHLAQNPDLLAARAERLDDLQTLLAGGRVDRFGYAARFKPSAKASSQELKQVLVETLVVWLSFWRDVLQRAAGSQAPLINLDRQAQIEQIAASLEKENAQRATEQVEQMLQDLRTNINPQLAAETLLLDLPRI